MIFISFARLGKLYFTHHFLMALSDTPNILPISEKDFVLIKSFKSSLETSNGFFLLHSFSHSTHRVALPEISFPQSTQFFIC